MRRGLRRLCQARRVPVLKYQTGCGELVWLSATTGKSIDEVDQRQIDLGL